MPSLEQMLVIAGAAEGSFFNTIDVRYKPSVANEKSGLSFGIFQFDVSTNDEAKAVLSSILRQAEVDGRIDARTADRIYDQAGRRNAGGMKNTPDWQIAEELLANEDAQMVIDAATIKYAQKKMLEYNSLMLQAKKVWESKASKNSSLNCDLVIFKDGSKENLHLFAYLLANLNRYPKNKSVFQDWLEGKNVKTATGPASGFELKCPPGLDEMHKFFNSLRIWDGTQGQYKNLRDRLDPALKTIGG